MRALSSMMCVLAGLAAGCASDSGGRDENAGPSDTAQAKLEAKTNLGRASATSSADAGAPSRADPCALNKWYGDGECDSWCPTFDRGDCSVTPGEPMACAEFWSPKDGKCDWTDPCGPVQDEDCGGVVCTAIWKLPDGECDPTDPCSKFQDADCQSDAGPSCTKIWKPADGKCDLSDPCATLQDEDCQGGGSSGDAGCGPTPTPIACRDILYETNGKCEAPDACGPKLDPVDCAVACIDIAYATNGKCEAAPGCEANDPVDCRAVPPTACIEIAYPTNGKCEAARGCEYTDAADCITTACDAILYPTNGKCEAPAGCTDSDPVDCKPLICPAIYIPPDNVCPADQPCDPDCTVWPVKATTP